MKDSEFNAHRELSDTRIRYVAMELRRPPPLDWRAIGYGLITGIIALTGVFLAAFQ